MTIPTVCFVYIFIVHLIMLNKRIIKNHKAIMNNYSEICVNLIRKHKCTVSLLIEQRDRNHCPSIV